VLRILMAPIDKRSGDIRRMPHGRGMAVHRAASAADHWRDTIARTTERPIGRCGMAVLSAKLSVHVRN